MRHVLICISLAAAGLALGGPSPAHADFCANYSNGGKSCGFRTFEQCLATISGVGGSCGGSASGGPGVSGGRSGGALGAPERERQRVRAREEEPRDRRAREREREREEPKAKQAAPKEEPPAKPAPATAAPAAPVTPPPPAAATTPAPAPAASNVGRKASPADARVYFVGLQDGAEIPQEVTLRFGVTGMGVAPAGFDNPNTGHHHLLIDAKLPPMDQPIPSDFNHLHFGAGQTEAVVTLAPGKHTFQLLFADENHVPHYPPVTSSPITVTVTKTKAP